MPPTRSLPPPVYVSTELANIPFRFRRKSLSEDDLPNPDYYLVPPSPSLSPSRSFSMSSSPPSSPTALNTSPTGPPHLDTAKIHPASSPAHPTTYHGYGYAYTYSRGLSHFASSHHDISSAPPKFVPPNSRSHPHPIISPPTTNPTRSTFSPTPAGAHGLRPSFASLLRKGAVHDEDEDDIEDYGFALDLDDILTGSSPTRRISFTTSSERDRPFVRSPVKPRLPRSLLHKDTATRPFPTSSATTSATPVELTLRPREAQCDSTRTSAAPADIPLPLAAPVTPIRARSDPRHVAPPFPSMGGTADADLDDTLPPSSPIVSPLSSPLSTPSTSRPSDSGCGSDSGHTERRATPPGEDRQQLHSDLTLPPSSPNPVPYTPARSSDTKREDDGMDMEMDLDLADLVASPPSPTLDALRITSRVAVRALLNPAPPPVSAPLPALEPIPVVDSADDVLPQLEMNEGEIEVEAETEVEGAEEKMVSILDGDVTPLVLPEASEEAVVDLGGPDVDGDVSEEVMATEIRVQIPEPEPEPCPGPTAQTKSRRSSCAPSRAHTPHVAQIQSQETPSSPLSPTPSSIADADVDTDIDFEMGCDAELPAPALPAPVSMPVAGPSRSRLSSRASSPTPPPKVKVPDADADAAEPPRKKMRREEDADVSHAKAKPKVTAKRPRTPTFADSESEREAEKAVLKPRKKSAAKANRQVDPAMTTKLVRKKRSRAVLSDDETESDSPSAPIRAPALPAPSLTVNNKKDGDRELRERRKEKPKKARAKDAQADLELENEPLHHHHHHPHLHAATSNLHPKPAKSSSLSAAPQKSATNIARPELPSPSALDAPRISVSKPPRLAQASADAASTKPKPSPATTAPAPATGKSKAAARSSRPDAEEIEIGAEADALVAAFDLPLPVPELEGMLIETLATARASSLATSALYGALMAARPALREMRLPALKEEGKVEEEEDDAAEAKDADAKSKRRAADAASRRAWVPALEAVLEAGWRRSGVFGKIVNSGTDLANHALRLEARWFYDPDQDADGDRAALVRTMMRRPGKRSETMKAKHYYWRPLPKISRWDDEDEL